MPLLSSVASNHLPVTGKVSFHSLSHLRFKNHLFEFCKLRASLYQKALFLPQVNDFLCTVRSKAMFDKSSDPGIAWDHALSLLSLYVSHGKRAWYISLSDHI